MKRAFGTVRTRSEHGAKKLHGNEMDNAQMLHTDSFDLGELLNQ